MGLSLFVLTNGTRNVRAPSSRSYTYKQPSLEPLMICRPQCVKATENMPNFCLFNGSMFSAISSSVDPPSVLDKCTARKSIIYNAICALSKADAIGALPALQQDDHVE